MVSRKISTQNHLLEALFGMIEKPSVTCEDRSGKRYYPKLSSQNFPNWDEQLGRKNRACCTRATLTTMKPSDPEFTARMLTAELFREHLKVTGTRQAMLNDLGVDRMPVIVPALGYTSAGEIKRAAIKRFARGEQYIVVPVGLLELIPGEEQARFRLAVLTIAHTKSKTSRVIGLDEIPRTATMAELVETLTPTKVWDIQELKEDSCVTEIQWLMHVHIPEVAMFSQGPRWRLDKWSMALAILGVTCGVIAYSTVVYADSNPLVMVPSIVGAILGLSHTFYYQ